MDAKSHVREEHKRIHEVILPCDPVSYGAELSKALNLVYCEYESVYGHQPKFDDYIKVKTHDDQIVLYFEENI